MFRFTLRGLAIYIAFAGSMLATTRVQWFPLANMALMIAAFLARPVIPIWIFLFASIGGVAGAQVGCLLLNQYFRIKFAGPPSQLRSGGFYEYWVHARPFAHQVGALIGATLGLLLERRRAAECGGAAEEEPGWRVD